MDEVVGEAREHGLEGWVGGEEAARSSGMAGMKG